MKDNVHSDYSGKTIEQIRAERGNPNLDVISEEELGTLLNDHRNKINSKPFKEITEDDYTRLYECLPPARMGNGWFFVGECSQYDLYPLCFNIGDKYFMGDRIISTPENELVKEMNDFWEEYQLKDKAV